MTETTITLHNTLTRTKETLRPFDPENVRMYVCGPTVYDFAHIGNARPVIVFDVLFRLLRHVYGADHVTYVRNITDVDDKINARALRDHPGLPLNEAIRLVTEKTAAQFHADVEKLGCLAPSVEPRATENINEMIALIQQLIDNGHAYIAKGDEGREVLFDTLSMPDYGGLSRRNLDEQQAGARIAVEAHKKSPGDFVLWKESDPDQPGWDAVYTLKDGAQTIHGRPGWHAECSAMSERYLWSEIESCLSPDAHAHPHQFDIHGGGLDLIFPHHENEIAQSRCAHGTPSMAQIWMHNGFLQVEGQKMSKSLGNFVTIHQLLDSEDFGGRKWPGEVLRLAMLMTHYREPIDFSVKRLEEAESMLRKWARTWQNPPEDAAMDEEAAGILADDLNTPALVAWLQKTNRAAETTDGKEDLGQRRRVSYTLYALGFRDLFSLFKGFSPSEQDEVDLQKDIESRLEALAAKDFAKADAIRAELLTKGIQLMDYKDAETGEKRTKWEVKR